MTPAELREARQKLGLSQAEMAKRMGYIGKRSAQTISDMERGTQAVTPQAALIVAVLLAQSMG